MRLVPVQLGDGRLSKRDHAVTLLESSVIDPRGPSSKLSKHMRNNRKGIIRARCSRFGCIAVGIRLYISEGGFKAWKAKERAAIFGQCSLLAMIRSPFSHAPGRQCPSRVLDDRSSTCIEVILADWSVGMQ